jgi:hypothetical protein
VRAVRREEDGVHRAEGYSSVILQASSGLPRTGRWAVVKAGSGERTDGEPAERR